MRRSGLPLALYRNHHTRMRFLEHVLLPEEMVSQAVVMDSPFAPKVESTNLHSIDETGPGPAHPVVLATRGFENLVAIPALFARTFDASVDERILDMLDEHSRCSP
jgi:hypothetical protein